MRPTDIAPKLVLDEALRLVRKNRNWVKVEHDPERGADGYKCDIAEKTWLLPAMRSGCEILSMYALGRWLADGPKVFRPTREQCAALEQVEVNLSPDEYCQPYPALFVELDYPPFIAVLCCVHDEPVLTFTLYSKGNAHDITTVVRKGPLTTSPTVEEALTKFDADCEYLREASVPALRVAVNSCLALTHFGCHLDYLFPKEVESDRRLAREPGERGERARHRLPLAVQVASFSQEVRLHRTAGLRQPGQPTGVERPPHWRRGHWAMQAHGPKHSLRKRIFRQPVMVRPDLFTGDSGDTEVTYR